MFFLACYIIIAFQLFQFCDVLWSLAYFAIEYIFVIVLTLLQVSRSSRIIFDYFYGILVFELFGILLVSFKECCVLVNYIIICSHFAVQHIRKVILI